MIFLLEKQEINHDAMLREILKLNWLLVATVTKNKTMDR